MALGLATGFLLFALAVRRVDWSAVARAVAGASVGWLALCVLALGVSYVLFAIRWRVLANTSNRLSVSDAFDFLMIGNVASLVLSSRLGDVARAVAAGRYHGLSASRLFGTILIERLLDVIMVLGFGVMLSVLMPIPPMVRGALLTLFAAAVAAAVVVWTGESGPLGAIARWLAHWRGPASRSLPMFARLLEGIGVVRERARVPLAFAVTAMAWICSAAAASCTIAAFRVQAPWYAGAFACVVVNLGGILPAPPAGIGVYHYMAMLALSPWAPDTSTAFAFALVSHALSVTSALTLGSASLARKGLSLRGLRRMAAAGVADSRMP